MKKRMCLIILAITMLFATWNLPVYANISLGESKVLSVETSDSIIPIDTLDIEIGLDLSIISNDSSINKNNSSLSNKVRNSTIPVPSDVNSDVAIQILNSDELNNFKQDNLSNNPLDSSIMANTPGAATVRPVTTTAYGIGDYITTSYGSRWFAFSVPANTTLFLRLEQPNNIGIDYDMYIWKLNSAGTSITELTYLSEFANDNYTFGLFGPILEDYSVANRTSQTAVFYVEIYAARGSSSTQPYFLYYQGANKIVNMNNVVNANQVNVVPTSNDYISLSNLSALIDSNWVAVNNSRVNGFVIGLEEITGSLLSIGYAFEVLTASYDSYGKIVFNAVGLQSGRYHVGGTCYIRVVPTSTVDSNKDYRIRIKMDNSKLVANYTLDFGNSFTPFYIGNLTYAMIRSSILLKVNTKDSAGNLLPHVPFTIRVVNYGWSNPLLQVKDFTYWTNDVQTSFYANPFGATPAQWPNYDNGYVEVIFGFDTSIYKQDVLIRN